MTFRACLRWTAGIAIAAIVAGGSPSSAASNSTVVTLATTTATPRSQSGAVLGTIDGQPRLIVDGKPFFFFGGAFFYPRIAPERWRVQMQEMRSIGVNTLDLYIPWNWHELSDGDFDFDGHTDARRNLREVLRLGTQLGFHFIIRPGPVIRNEWRNGGYPAWLLTRPEYGMPLHDILEGRYPATATLQNVHSDDAAAEWLRNTTHLTYSARWLARALAECKPYANHILAIQLDDDQGAYIDNQTYPAPHFQQYIAWLNDRIHDALGSQMPTFINTYQIRVPSSSPVWTMGNWYQSDANTIGQHDRVDLDFSTLLLALNHRGPLAQSEFQAGWLAGPEDPMPRPADPRNTAVALTELLALGVQGVVDFPLQDTLAEPGWEAPFSNAFYGWDAALGFASGDAPLQSLSPPSRLPQTEEFGRLVQALGPAVSRMRRVHDVAIAYAEPPPRSDSTPPAGAADIVSAVRADLATCIDRGRTCDIVDAHTDTSAMRTYRLLIVPPAVEAFAPIDAARLRSVASSARVPVATFLDASHGAGTTTLTGPLGTLRIASNWTDQAKRVSFGVVHASIAPHSVELRVHGLALSALGLEGDHRRVSSDDCTLHTEQFPISKKSVLLLRGQGSVGCTVTVTGGPRTATFRIAPRERMTLPDRQIWADLSTISDGVWINFRSPPSLTNISPDASLRFRPLSTINGAESLAETGEPLDGLGVSVVVMRNDRLRLVIDPQAGARAFSLQADAQVQLSHVAGHNHDDASSWSRNAFDATGAWRDDVSVPLAPSPRDYIARFTHQYPTGTYNRTYTTQTLASGAHASVRFSYTMPDVAPAGAIFERIVSIEPMSSRVVVDERLHWPDEEMVNADVASLKQQLVVRSSIPLLRMAGNAMSDAPCVASPDSAAVCTLPMQQRSVSSYREGFAFVVAWSDGDVAAASWTPYRSTGTLALTMTPGVWHRTVYAYAAEPTLEAARAFGQAERAWVSANPPPSR